MISLDQFKSTVAPDLRRTGVLPERFVEVDEAEFLADLFSVCFDNNQTAWQKQSFMFDKYGTENLDFQFVVAAAMSAITDFPGITDEAMLGDLIYAAKAFLTKTAPAMPAALRQQTAEFVVRRSAFRSDIPIVRGPLDACAANWEEYPLPPFDWLWPELEHELETHNNELPKGLRIQDQTAYGDRNLDQWRLEVQYDSGEHWLERRNMGELRQIQKKLGLGPARTKRELVASLFNLSPRPPGVQSIIDSERRQALACIDGEESDRKQPTSQLYRSHLVWLVQTRMDSYFLAVYGHGSPSKRKERDEASSLQLAKTAYEKARTINYAEEERLLRAEFAREVSPCWESSEAARRVYDRVMRNLRNKATDPLEAFIAQYRQISSKQSTWLRHRLCLHEVCALCVGRDTYISYCTSDDLPPFHPLCRCGVPYWDFSLNEREEKITDSAVGSHPGPHARRAVDELLKKCVSGLSFRPPTLLEMIQVEEAILKDQRPGLVAALFHRFLRK